MRTATGRHLLAAALAALFAGTAAAYEPEPWNLKARREFAAQRFGVFIHWGLYANYAQGEWYLKSGSDWKESLDREAYERMMHGFCPSKFDAREWVKVIAGAGAKYITITSRHHDGFSLWPTAVDDGYNIAKTPFGRDILGELKSACDEAGLQLNFYYSLMDWHRKDYPPGDCAVTVLGRQKGDYASYKKFMLGQIGELISRYHPGNIWFDGEWEHARHQDDGTWKRTLDWQLDDIYDFIHERKTLVANNNHQPIRAKEDIQLFERDLPGDDSDAGFSKNQPVVSDRPVEQCDVIQEGVWGYRIANPKFRTPENVVAMVARAAAKGSNLLMNIGPDGSGQLPAKAVRVMGEVGKWFRKNGESIYGTEAGGLSLGKAVVSTRKGGVLYLHFLDPQTNAFEFASDVDFACATVVATGARVPIERTAEGKFRLVAPRAATDAFDVVIRLTPPIANPFKRFGIELAAPKPREVARFCSFVRNRLAPDGVDTIVLRTGYGYAFESHPECRERDALSKADAHAIAEACRAAKIRIVAKMNLLGHQSHGNATLKGLLKAHPDMDESKGAKTVRANYCRSICPRHPESLRFAADLAAELAQAFETDTVHIGCDEVFEIGRCPRCAETPTGTLFADWVNGLTRALKARGVRKTMIWGDRLVDCNLTGGRDFWESSDNGTWKALGKVDRDIEICDWRYHPRDGYPSVGLFGDAGYRIWVSPWANPHATELFLAAAKAQDKGQVIGLLHTTWMAAADFMDLVENRECDFTRRHAATDEGYVLNMHGSVDVYRALTAKARPRPAKASAAAKGGFPVLLPMPKEITHSAGSYAPKGAPKVSSVRDAALPPEGYALAVTADGIAIRYADDAGRFYASVTLDQLRTADGRWPAVTVKDWPTYGYRGVLLDDGRVLYGKAEIKKVLDQMAKVKLNVFHWHFIEPGAWRLVVPGYPKLTENLPPNGRYTRADIREIVDYAAARAIRVMPEIEMPGHNDVVGHYREFAHEGGRDLCPSNPKTIAFFKAALDEAAAAFPYETVHLGGDEVGYESWKKCPRCQAKMKELGLAGEAELQAWFMNVMSDHLKAKGKRGLGWTDMLLGLTDNMHTNAAGWWTGYSHQKNLSKDLVINAWYGDWECAGGSGAVAANLGYKVIQYPAEHCYFDYSQGLEGDLYQYAMAGVHSLRMAYEWDPRADVKEAFRSNILGVGCANWSEAGSNRSVLEWKLWPRGFATAEIGWGAPAKKDYAEFLKRAKSLVETFRKAGINAANL